MHPKPPKGFVFYSDEPLKTGDIVFCYKGGLAIVNSGLTTNEATRLDSIPEDWTCDLDAIADCGNLINDSEERFDKIIFYMPLAATLGNLMDI